MKSHTTIFFSVLLLWAFLLFNVGVPVVQYLCPMMNSENPICSMMPASGDQAESLSNQMPSCCAKYIVAERNTTPFLKIHTNLNLDEALSAAPLLISEAESLHDPAFLSVTADPHVPPGPLFLLHSSLII